MGFLFSVLYLVLLGFCSALVCCGLLALLVRVPPLVSRQRATLWGVRS